MQTFPFAFLTGPSGGGAPAPAVSSVDKSYTRTQGGILITITGTNFVSGATVAISGTACTSVAFTSATELKCVTPAKAAGSYDIVVTNPDAQTSGASGAGLIEYVNPASIFTGGSLVRWHSETYSAGVWTDESGTSNTSQSDSGKRPTATTLAGTTDRPATHVALSFDGTDDGLNNGGAGDMFTTEGVVAFIFKAAVSQNAEANIVAKNYGSEDIVFGLRSTAPGKLLFGIGGSTDTDAAISSASVNDDAVHRAIGTYATTVATLYLDGAAEADTGTNSMVTGTADFNSIGSAMSNSDASTDYYYTGLVAEVVVASVEPTATQRNKLDAYLRDCAGQAA